MGFPGNLMLLLLLQLSPAPTVAQRLEALLAGNG
jgi:hypothetical protein